MPKPFNELVAILERGGLTPGAAVELSNYLSSDGTDKNSGEIASATISTNYPASGTGFTTVTGLQLVVPANSGPCNLEMVTGCFFQLVTGTNAATVGQTVACRIVDELNNILGYSANKIFGTGTSQSQNWAIPLGCVVPNSSIDKTYHVEYSHSHNGTAGASSTFIAGSPFLPATFQAYRR